jgi:hypothetical protein
MVHDQKNISNSKSPAMPAVIIEACEFFFASKDADMIYALLFMQI